MRITNQMMINNTLLNINRNRTSLAEYEEQLSTGKKIQRPSDDPIVAVRALRLRTNVNEISQYKTNAEDAISWCEITEQAVSNVEDIVDSIRELAVQASTDVLNLSNRQNIITEIGELMTQFLNETNASYAGRYVFGGYKTNVPVVFDDEDDAAAASYEITEHLGSENVETVSRVVNNGTEDEVVEANRIRLGYSGLSNADDAALLASLGGGFTAVNVLNSSDVDAYMPVAGEVNILEDTGELIFNEADVASIPADFDMTYEKTGFETADLVPDHYFDGTNLNTGVSFTQQEEDIKYQISYSQELTVNTIASDVVSVDFQRDIEELIAFSEEIADDDSLASELEEDILGDMFSELIGKMDDHLDDILETRSTIGGKINRLELTISRLEEDELNFTDLLSQNEDIDYSEVYIKMSSMETVYQASLSVSSKVLQPTLLDFLG